VAFDTTWTDAQAQALGSVYTTEIRIDGTPALKAGIDNFSLTAVPEPSSYALVVAGLAVAGGAARSRRRAR
jgi:hypothetical protein